MRPHRPLHVALSAAAIAAASLLPASAATTTISGELRGDVVSASSSTLVMHATGSTTNLRLLRARTVRITVASTVPVTRAGKRVKLTGVRAYDGVVVQARCTFTITSSSTKIACKALRVSATPPYVPTPVQMVMNGKVVALTASGFSVTPTSFEAVDRARLVADALAATPPVPVRTDSATAVTLGGVKWNLGAITSGASVHVSMTCQPAKPYDCRATAVNVLGPTAQPVRLVGIATLVTSTQLVMDVETAVHATDSATNVQMLRIKQLTIAAPADTEFLRGSTAIDRSVVVPGLRVTVNASCRLEVPFACTATRVALP